MGSCIIGLTNTINWLSRNIVCPVLDNITKSNYFLSGTNQVESFWGYVHAQEHFVKITIDCSGVPLELV